MDTSCLQEKIRIPRMLGLRASLTLSTNLSSRQDPRGLLGRQIHSRLVTQLLPSSPKFFAPNLSIFARLTVLNYLEGTVRLFSPLLSRA